MATFTLEIKTPGKSVFFDRALRLTAPAADGEIGILPGHAPLATELKAGNLKIVLETGEIKNIAGSAGFLIVNKNDVSVLMKK